jgi:membrane peptidoglycan carboxypeptidase
MFRRMSTTRSRPPGSLLTRTLRFLGVSVLAGAMAAGIALPAVGLLGLGAKNAAESFNSLPDVFKTPPLSQASQIYDADGGLIAAVYDRDRTVIPGDQIAPVMRKALVDIEDTASTSTEPSTCRAYCAP